MRVFYSNTHRRHEPPFEVLDGGEKGPYLESPSRADHIVAALRAEPWAQVLDPAPCPLKNILAIHSAEYIEFLSSAWQEWAASGEPAQPEHSHVLLPATFALRRTPPRPSSILGRAGYHIMDLSAPLVDGTYAAARAAADCALSAAMDIASASGQAAFALCRPPGHHAGPDYAAGYCYINNAAVAAHWLSARGRVAVLDVDYHAGNGTQDIFYSRADVLTISLHADPAWEYPYYAGYASETGSGDGTGFHRNFPLASGTGDHEYLAVLSEALELIVRFAPTFLVVSAGMDIYGADRLGRFSITRDGIRSIGEHIAALGLPTALIMEGGYDTDALGANVIALLSAFSERGQV